MWTMRRSGVSFVVVAWLTAGSARADEPTAKQTQANALFEEGRKLLNEDHVTFSDPAAACAKFGAAVQLDPDAAGIMLNLGLCNEQLKKYKTALDWFRKAQARASETGHLEHEKAARMRTVDLAAKVATIKLALPAGTPDAKIKLDGDEVKKTDYLRVEVDPGHHVLDAGAPGMKNLHQEFDVEGQGGQTLTLTFVAGENAIVIDRGASRRHLAVGGGALMAAAGGLSLYEHHIYCQNVDCGNGMNKGQPKMVPDAVKNANGAHDVAHVWGTSIFTVGAVAIGVGVYLYLTAPKQERIDQTVWAPLVGPDRVGLAVTGGF